MLSIFGGYLSFQSQRPTLTVVCDDSESDRMILWFRSRNPDYFSSVSERRIVSSSLLNLEWLQTISNLVKEGGLRW